MGPATVVPNAAGLSTGDPLARALGRAADVRGAARAVVDHLAARGVLPSVYLEQGGRLRCQAVHGYWHIFDGLPLDTGLIGRTYATGEPVVELDVARSEAYRTAAPAIVSELCVPVRAHGRVAGVLNAESRTPLGTADAAEVARCAELLGARLEDLGDLHAVSPAQILARAGARLAALTDPAELVAEAASAARELSGFSSVALALADGPAGALAVRHASGPFGPVLAGLGRAELSEVAAWVDAATSSYTVDDADGIAFAHHAALRAAGVRGLIVLPLAAAGERLGVLVLADAGARPPGPGEVELLELLAIQAAGGLKTSAALEELSHRAAHDPLTGLGHHATFRAALPALRRTCPPGHAPAVLLIDIDGFKGINDRLGHAAGDTILRRVAAYLHMAAPSGVTAYRIGGDEFAVLAGVGGETEALALGERLSEAVRAGVGVTLSVGVAFARRGEDDAALRDRADAALYAVKRAGRDGVAIG